jgi:hypothetical protein
VGVVLVVLVLMMMMMMVDAEMKNDDTQQQQREEVDNTQQRLQDNKHMKEENIQQQQHELVVNVNNKNTQQEQQHSRNLASTNSKCDPPSTITKNECQHWIDTFCTGKLSWVGPNCGTKTNDGGCQKIVNGVYCKWKCKDRCLSRPGCVWHPTDGGCKKKETNCDGTLQVGRELPGFTQGAALHVPNWATPSLIDTINITSPFQLFRIDFYVTSVRDIPINTEFSALDFQIQPLGGGTVPGKATTSAPSGSWTTASYLLTSIDAGASLFPDGETATGWYVMRFDATITLPGLTFPSAGAYQVRFSLPYWRSFPFSLLTRKLDYSSSQGLDTSTCLQAAPAPVSNGGGGGGGGGGGNTPTTSVNSPQSNTRLCSVLNSMSVQQSVFSLFS